MRRFTSLALLIVGLLVLVGGGLARAQDATPGASPSAATGCDVQPRSTDALISLWYNASGTPIATPTSEAAPSPAVLSGAQPADAATAAAVTQTIQRFIACVNAGDFARETALMTDNLAASYGPEQGTTVDQVRAFLASTPEAIATEQAATLASTTPPVVLPDGRVSVEVTINDPTAQPAQQVALFILKQVDGSWLLDAFAAPPSSATPAATPGA
jgi:hypothetical protein